MSRPKTPGKAACRRPGSSPPARRRRSAPSAPAGRASGSSSNIRSAARSSAAVSNGRPAPTAAIEIWVRPAANASTPSSCAVRSSTRSPNSSGERHSSSTSDSYARRRCAAALSARGRGRTAARRSWPAGRRSIRRRAGAARARPTAHRAPLGSGARGRMRPPSQVRVGPPPPLADPLSGDQLLEVGVHLELESRRHRERAVVRELDLLEHPAAHAAPDGNLERVARQPRALGRAALQLAPQRDRAPAPIGRRGGHQRHRLAVEQQPVQRQDPGVEVEQARRHGPASGRARSSRPRRSRARCTR